MTTTTVNTVQPIVPPGPPSDPRRALAQALADGVTWGDSGEWLPALPKQSVDLFFMSPPYSDQRVYSKIHPDRYVEWFLPYAAAMRDATTDSGWMVINIKERVAKTGSLKGQRHPYVFNLVLELQQSGWRWIETYIWYRTNAIPGRFGPRTKDSFEYVFAFAKGERPHWDLDAVRVPYRADEQEIARRLQDSNGRKNTDAGFGRDRTRTYLKGGADPGNVIPVAQTYNQYGNVGGEHTAVMPEGLASFFVRAACPPQGVVIDPFAGSSTTAVVARRHGRQAGGFEFHQQYADLGRRRIAEDTIEEQAGVLRLGM
ncbi:MAG: DNA-methyltransferase [Acidimicrobiales bacterium]